MKISVSLFVTACSFAAAALLLSAAEKPRKRAVPESGYAAWEVYGGGAENIRYSRLDQITRDNVTRLERAWSYDTGDAFEGSEMQCNPIVVDGVLYATSPKLRVFALDAATGQEIWSFQPTVDGRLPGGRSRNRGLMYWSDGEQARLYVAMRHLLYAIDAKTGRPAAGFGDGGAIDLRQNLARPPESLTVSMNTPGVVHGDLLILGSVVSEGLPSAPGDIRAYDALTGELRWSFHTIPHPGEPGYETWPENAWKIIGGANSWAGMSLDERRGLLYVPTGSAAADFYGGNRWGDNLYANSLLCLKAASGELVWHFQFVKHDIWDRDLPAPPNLVTVSRGGKLIDAVAQTTKSGHVFVFDRETGESLFPLEEIEVPPSDIRGEKLAPKQILPLKPPPFARQKLTEEMLTKRTPEARRIAAARFGKLLSGGQFTPSSKQGTIIFPGFDGGAEWGGQAFDPETGLLYVNSNEMAWVLRIIEKKSFRGAVTAKRLYLRNCAACHQDDLSGSPPEFPSLLDIAERRPEAEIRKLIREGAGRMPGYRHLGARPLEALTRFVVGGEDVEVSGSAATSSPYDLPYAHDGYNRFLDPDGYPAIEPPWGTLNAIDLDEGEIRWSIPFGEFPELAARGIGGTGTENYGGPAVTAGGLLFIGATNHDRKFRAFDKRTGELLWETLLPAAGNATPAVYEVDGRQFVVIGAGGGKSGAPSGGTYVAFALPARD